MFSSRSFMIWGLTFKSSIQFEFILEYGIRRWSVHFLYVSVQFSQHTYWMDCLYPTYILLGEEEVMIFIILCLLCNCLSHTIWTNIMHAHDKKNKWYTMLVKSLPLTLFSIFLPQNQSLQLVSCVFFQRYPV